MTDNSMSPLFNQYSYCLMTSIKIRSFQPSDLQACRDLFVRGHKENSNPDIYIEYVLQDDLKDIQSRYLTLPNGHWWVAIDTDRDSLIGQVALLPLEIGSPSYYKSLPADKRDAICELVRMSVHSDYQRKGVGKQLLDTLLDFAREHDYREIYLTTGMHMKKAQLFYESNGFVAGEIGRYKIDPTVLKSVDDLKLFFSSNRDIVVFPCDSSMPDEDRERMNDLSKQSPYYYYRCFRKPLV